MVEGLDMTLDDMIKKRKEAKAANNRGHGGSGGSGSGGPGPTRRLVNRGGSSNSRMMPYTMPPWVRMREMEAVGRTNDGNLGTMLHVSNLNYNVTQADIKVLFSDVGDLKWYAIHYDGSGRPKGTAAVVFERRSDAIEAIMRYNDRILDGKRMKIVLLESDVIPAIPSASHGMETQRAAFGRQHGPMRAQGQGQRRAQGQQVQRRGQREQISAEALNADLDKYHEDVMFK